MNTPIHNGIDDSVGANGLTVEYRTRNF